MYRIQRNVPSPPAHGSSTGSSQKTTQRTIAAQTLAHTEELMRRAAIYSSIMDSLVASLLDQIPDDKKSKVGMEQIKIMVKASCKSATSAVAAASNLYSWYVAMWLSVNWSSMTMRPRLVRHLFMARTFWDPTWQSLIRKSYASSIQAPSGNRVPQRQGRTFSAKEKAGGPKSSNRRWRCAGEAHLADFVQA